VRGGRWGWRRRSLGCEEGVTSDLLRPEIAKSWKRCELIGVSPAVSLEPSYDDFDGQSRLVRAAQPVLDRLAAELDDTRTCVILADAEARIVDRRLGMSSLSKGLDKVSALPGVLYDESRAGTNGLGTAVEERRPVAVRGDEHFAERLRSFTCTVRPGRAWDRPPACSCGRRGNRIRGASASPCAPP